MLTRLCFTGNPTRVVLGAGASTLLAGELSLLGARRPLVVSTRGRRAAAERLATAAGVLDLAEEHVPLEVAVRARAEVASRRADALVAFGGGSTIGLAKAIALELPLPIVVLPTTYSGSEMSTIWGITEGGKKRTGRDERARAAAVLYDPELSRGLPPSTAVASAFNALAHAVEALYAANADAETLLWAELSAEALGRTLPALASGIDAGSGEQALFGSCLAGACLGRASMGLHHKLCHVLGGSFGLPHAPTHAVLLPHVARFNLDHALEARERLGRALNATDPAAALYELAERVRAPRTLAELGLSRSALDQVVEQALVESYPNPRPVDARALREILAAAYDGRLGEGARTSVEVPMPTEPVYQQGFASPLESEALPGALPRGQNSPQHVPYGLYAELLSGTPFTVRRAQNRRAWLYKIRPSVGHSAFLPLGPRRFGHDYAKVTPNKLYWKPLPLPAAGERVDWLDGLATLGGWGRPNEPGYAVHLYAANAAMKDRCFVDADGDLLLVPEHGALDCRTEFGVLRVAPGEVLLLGRGMKFSIAPHAGSARGYVLEVFGRHLELPERGLIGSNGLADERHFLAPVAAFEDRECAGFQVVMKTDGALHAATQGHSPFDVVAWHGNYAPFKYDLSRFNPLATVSFDHQDPSVFTVLTSPYDDHGRAVADFVVFPPRWVATEHTFRPPFHHRNAASEINGVLRNEGHRGMYQPGCCFVTPLLSAHGISTHGYEMELQRKDEPERIPESSLWFMFESCLPFRPSRWALETPLHDPSFDDLFEGAKKRFDPGRP